MHFTQKNHIAIGGLEERMAGMSYQRSQAEKLI